MPSYWTDNGQPAPRRAPQRKEKPMTNGEWSPSDYYLIRHEIVTAINRYALLHEKKGGFLMAVFSNNLREAIARADRQNGFTLKQIICYCHNEIPGCCWGSEAKVKAWLEEPVGKRRGLTAPESDKEIKRQDEQDIWGTTAFNKGVSP